MSFVKFVGEVKLYLGFNTLPGGTLSVAINDVPYRIFTGNGPIRRRGPLFESGSPSQLNMFQLERTAQPRLRPKIYTQVLRNNLISQPGPPPIAVSERYSYIIRDWHSNTQLLRALAHFHSYLDETNAKIKLLITPGITPAPTSVYLNPSTGFQSGTSAITVGHSAAMIFYVGAQDQNHIVLADPGGVVASNLQLGSLGSLRPIPSPARPVDPFPPDIDMAAAEPTVPNPILDRIDHIMRISRILPTPGQPPVRTITFNLYFEDLKKLRDLVPPFYLNTKMSTSFTRVKDTVSGAGDGWSQGSESEQMAETPSPASQLVSECCFKIMLAHNKQLVRLLQMGTHGIERRSLQLICSLFKSYS